MTFTLAEEAEFIFRDAVADGARGPKSQKRGDPSK